MARPPRGSADMERIWLPCSVVPFYSLTPSKTEQCYFFVKFSQNFSKRNALRQKSPRPVLPWTGTFHGEEAAGRFLQLKGEDGGEQGADALIPQVGVNENAVIPVGSCAMGQTAKYDVGSEMPDDRFDCVRIGFFSGADDADGHTFHPSWFSISRSLSNAAVLRRWTVERLSLTRWATSSSVSSAK